MRASTRDTGRRHVAVFVDSSSIYGRGMLRGIGKYVDTFRAWSLCVDTYGVGLFARDPLRNWRGDGILVHVEYPLLAGRTVRSRIPTVELEGCPLHPGRAAVGNDDLAIGRLAAEHLVERRLTHFAYCGYEMVPWSRRRGQGFTAMAAQAGQVHPSCAGLNRPRTPAQSESNRRHLIPWVRGLPKPVGIMACSDRQGQRLLDACLSAGIAVPEEVAVIGSDNDEELCLLCDPPLTSVQGDPCRIGYEAAALLDRLMRAPRRAKHFEPILIPPVGVVTRRSTDLTATTDRLIAAAARAICERACRGLTVKQLLQELAISHSEFYRRFQRVLGRSPHQQILHVRLERVKSLLLQTPFSLEKIAELTGFDHPEYLTVAFKRECGMPPSEFRRRQERRE
jgi:LacI family transcriptional regulator